MPASRKGHGPLKFTIYTNTLCTHMQAYSGKKDVRLLPDVLLYSFMSPLAFKSETISLYIISSILYFALYMK